MSVYHVLSNIQGDMETMVNIRSAYMQTTWPVSWEICMQVRKQQLQLDMEQQIGSKLWKE